MRWSGRWARRGSRLRGQAIGRRGLRGWRSGAVLQTYMTPWCGFGVRFRVQSVSNWWLEPGGYSEGFWSQMGRPESLRTRAVFALSRSFALIAFASLETRGRVSSAGTYTCTWWRLPLRAQKQSAWFEVSMG